MSGPITQALDRAAGLQGFTRRALYCENSIVDEDTVYGYGIPNAAKKLHEQKVEEHREILEYDSIQVLHATPWQHVKAALRSYEQDGKFATADPTWWNPLLKAMGGDEDKAFRWAWRHVALSLADEIANR